MTRLRNYQQSGVTEARPDETTSETQFELQLRRRNARLQRESGIAIGSEDRAGRSIVDELQNDVRYASDIINDDHIMKLNSYELR
jgi:hypothetical protein